MMTGQTNQPSRAAAATEGSAMEFSISGMNCQSCVRKVREALQEVAGVAEAKVELESARATVRWHPKMTPAPQAILAAVTRAGFNAQTIGTAEHARPPAVRAWSPLTGWQFNVAFGGTITLALMLGEWVLGFGHQRWFQWASFALALPVQGLCGARFYRGAWNQLRSRSSNMDTLVALGSTTAFVYSAWGLLADWPVHFYFMEAAAIISLISTGHWLESKASERAASSLRALLRLAPATARRLEDNGTEHEAPISDLAIGDRVVLRPGDLVPTDGEVVQGQSAVNEAMLTGESLPVEKGPGARLYGGTANQNGRLVMRVTATGEATALAQIIAAVQRAQNSRAKIQKVGDQVSSVFVPVVVAIALITALWWGLAYEQARHFSLMLMPWLWRLSLPETALAAAVVHAAAVLIVACPCAMGLATPAAIMAGANVAARRGILIRDGAALEKTGRISAVVFDKTGTLTQGQVTVAAVEDFRGTTPAQPSDHSEAFRSTGNSLAAVGAALARPSNHPLSQAVARHAEAPARGSDEQHATAAARQASHPSVAFELTDWRELRGQGVQANSSLGVMRLGSLSWLRECKVELTPGDRFVRDWSQEGASILGLAADRRLLGAFALRDALKPHAPDVVARLKRQGKATYLITGDHSLTAAALAAQAGIDAENVFAEVRPEGKAEILRQLQAHGLRVAFVGDGINDAPALEQADLGVAVSHASDVAREAADIILLRSDIEAIPEALELAQATLRTIKQNLFWAFFYNAASVPLAALGFISPVLCAAAMGLSDLIVIGNALRLFRRKLA